MLRSSRLSGACSVLALSAFFAFSASALAASVNLTGSSPITLNDGDTGQSASGDQLIVSTTGSGNAVTLNGSVVITNAGLIQNQGAGRGIQAPSGGASVRSITFTNSGTLISADDAFRINVNLTGGDVTINNSGTIRSTNNGQAIDFGAITGSGATIKINNLAGGTIQSAGEDALRPGNNAIVTNWGLITSATGGDGVDAQDTSIKVINKTGGEISAGKHGINVGPGGKAEVTNEVGGKITGRNGSGIGSDNIGMNGKIINYGEITGRWDQVSVDGDGDGIDLDGTADILNFGTIRGAGAAGFDSGNRANNSEGISIGGGTIVNSGLITGANYGIVVNNDSNPDGTRSGVAKTDLTNSGTIVGENGFAIRFENKTGTDKDDDKIVNSGTIIGKGVIPDTSTPVLLKDGVTKDPAHGTIDAIAYGAGEARFIRGDGSAIQTGEGKDVLINSGTITGENGRAINMEGGDDTLTNSGTINGSVDLGGGTNTFDNLAGGRLNAGALLAPGAGRTLNNAGTIAPGGDGTIRTTALTGRLTQTATGGLAIDIDAAGNLSDRVDVSEMAALSGNVMLSVTKVAIASGTVTVLTGNDVTHDQLGLIASPALQAKLLYPDAKTVQVSYALSFAPTGIGLNDNQNSLGGYLNNVVIANPDSLAAVTGALLKVTSNGAYTGALDQLSPELYGDTAVSTLYGTHTFGNALLSCHPRDGAYAAVSEDQCVWADITGRDYQQDRTSAGIGYDEQTWGFSGGAQVSVGKDLKLGFAGGFEEGSSDTTSGASADIDRVYGGVSLKHTSGPWLLAAAVYGGKGWSDTSRPINFGGLATVAVGSQDVEHLSGRVRAAYEVGSNALYVKPMVDLEATQLWLGSVQETGGPGALSIAGSNETVFSAAPALEIGGQTAIGGGVLLRPFARAGAIFYSNDDIAITSVFAGAPASVPAFQTQVEIERVMGTVGAGLDFVWSDASTVKLHYDGMFGEDTQQHAFGAKASFKF